MLMSSFCAMAAIAQTASPPLSGDYTGTLGTLHLVVHFTEAGTGKLAVVLDSPDQGVSAIPAESAVLSRRHLSLGFPSLYASYSAEESVDGATLTGFWTQDTVTPLVLHLQPRFVPTTVPSAIDGDWKGVLDAPAGPLTLLLHVKSDRSGTEYLSFDTPAQNVFGLIADRVTFAERQLAFNLPVVHGHYAGKLREDGAVLSGTWTQGAALPLAFMRVVPFAAAEKPSAVDGDWMGVVRTPRGELRTVLHVRSDRAGAEFVALDSPDQGAPGIEATHAAFESGQLRFEVPRLHGTFTGKADAETIDGTWTQGAAMPVHLTRSPKPSSQASPTTGPLKPLPFTELLARLDTELKPFAENPALAGTSGLGVAIGVIDHGKRRLLTYGIAKPASLFEIGSITKTFTGLVLSQMVIRKAVSLDTPLRVLLPPGTVLQPTGPEITLLSLATHRSGLPRMPTNFHSANPLNPYADYSLADLYGYLRQSGVARPASASFVYSNTGAALLGQGLAEKAGISYTTLLEREVLIPLRMTNTYLAIPAGEHSSSLRGLTDGDDPASAWDLDAFAPAGGLHATVGDMLIYMEAQLHPPAALEQAVTLQHQVRADAGLQQIAISWLFDPASGDYWHDGGTGGFTSYAFFNPRRELAGVVLVNRASGLANSLGKQIAALLEGRESYPLQH